MKTLTFILGFLLLMGCNGNDDNNNNTQSQNLFGTWEQIEFYGSDGGTSPQWYSVDDGYTYTFKKKSVLLSNQFACDGVYSLDTNNLVSINFNCNASKFNATYIYRFENNQLILEPAYPNPCDEGCSEKYKRIK